MPDSRFRGFTKPTYTQVPDELIDELLPDLSGAELKVLLYIIRRTFGFKKDSDNISLSQICNGITTHDGRVLDRGTGLNKDTVTRAIKRLEDDGYIVRERRSSPERGFEATAYQLNFLPLSENPTSLPDQIRQALVGKSDIQETVNNKTARQQRLSSRRKTKEPYDEQERMEEIRRSAERAGFNPEIFGSTPESE